jgi:hypothetical protein
MPAAPFKELRFTRARQAVTFVIAGVVLLGVAGALYYLWWWHRPDRPGWMGLAVLVPMVLSWASLRTAARLARHAYLLLSPIGIEIFPFFRPAQNMQLVSWTEIQHAEVTPGHRLLKLDLTGGGGIFLTLAPLRPAARALLAKAIAGVMEKRRTGMEVQEAS